MPLPVDERIIEPCETLTSPDGYTLTPEGQRVLKCIGAVLLQRYSVDLIYLVLARQSDVVTSS
jgi:hypothetical protein